MPLDIDRYLHEELAADLLSERPEDRKNAVIVLARLGRGDETLDTLRYLAETDPDPELRELARETWQGSFDHLDAGRLDEEVRVTGDDPKLLDLARVARCFASESPLVRLSALVAAARTLDARLLEPALAQLDRETDDWVLATLLKTVGQLGSAIHVPRIQRFLVPPASPRVVATTVEAIATLDAEAGFALLVPLLSATDSRVQASAIGAMIAVEKKAALETLVAMSRSPKSQARESAVHCLKRLTEPEVEPILTDMLLAEVEPRLVPRIAGVLAERGTRAALARLAPVAARDPAHTFHAEIARLAEAIQLRLNVGQDERAALDAGPLPPPRESPLLASSPNFVRSSSRTQRTRRLSEPPPAAGLLAGLLAARAFKPAAAALALLWVVAWCAWSARTDPGPRVPPARELSPTPLASVALSATPGRYLNQVVRWEGQVERVDAASSTVRLRAGRQVFTVTMETDASAYKPGDHLAITGRVVGRSRLGPVYLQGLRAEKI